MSTEPRTTTYVTYLLPGAFLSEELTREVPSRDANEAARNAPPSAFAFTFHDVVSAVVTVEGHEYTTRSVALNISPRYYIDAEVMDADAVAALPGDHRTLLLNMQGQWPLVVRCRTGNFQPFEDGDRLVSAKTDGEPR